HDVANRYRWVAIREYVQNVHRGLILLWQYEIVILRWGPMVSKGMFTLAKKMGYPWKWESSRSPSRVGGLVMGVSQVALHASTCPSLEELNRVVLEADHQPAAAPAGNGSRWQRALRLVCRRITTHARRSPPALEFDVSSFHTLTMLS
ncbi:hypothetical protein Golax_020218, partial [Gossypium laxum]|nr:hypothetical protein [Gossypium laxum]